MRHASKGTRTDKCKPVGLPVHRVPVHCSTRNTTKQRKRTVNAIAYRYWSKACPLFYVAQVKPRGRGDWGYTTRASEALPLSPYWQKRFAADCNAVGTMAHFIETN